MLQVSSSGASKSARSCTDSWDCWLSCCASLGWSLSCASLGSHSSVRLSLDCQQISRWSNFMFSCTNPFFWNKLVLVALTPFFCVRKTKDPACLALSRRIRGSVSGVDFFKMNFCRSGWNWAFSSLRLCRDHLFRHLFISDEEVELNVTVAILIQQMPQPVSPCLTPVNNLVNLRNLNMSDRKIVNWI
jgi:hypothetical protein